MPSDSKRLTRLIREAAREAFRAVMSASPEESFYYFALITTGDGLRPGPSASSLEGLRRTLEDCRAAGEEVDPSELRWSEADSPHNLIGDEFFQEVEQAFLEGGDHRNWEQEEFLEEVGLRYAAMEAALAELDREGFFGEGEARNRVVINVVAPGEEEERVVLERASRLNPEGALAQLRADLGG
jgi:hypothetical protein